jgi:formate-dependent nitrite reductase membrane component NrfD
MPAGVLDLQQLIPITTHYSPWMSWNIIIYLFLGGAAGGAFLTGALCDLIAGRKRSYEYAAMVGIHTSFPLILLGGLILALHLKKPEAALNVFIMMSSFHNSLQGQALAVPPAGILDGREISGTFFRPSGCRWPSA